MVETAGIADGIVSVFVAHSTAAISLIEYEPGGVSDLRELMDRLVPPEADYQHNDAGDTNAHAHLQAAVDRPVRDRCRQGRPAATGTWQQFVLSTSTTARASGR